MRSLRFAVITAVSLAAVAPAVAWQRLNKQDSDRFEAKMSRIVALGNQKQARPSGPVTTPISDAEINAYLEYGAKAAYRVDYSHEVLQEWFDGVETVGVTSGASVPEVLVQEVLADLADAGYRDVEEVKTAQEDLMFSLPKELRQDAAGRRDDRALGGRSGA